MNTSNSPLGHANQKVFSIKALRRVKVHCGIALKQLNAFLDNQKLSKSLYTSGFEARKTRHASWRQTLKSPESPSEGDIITVPYLTSRLRQLVPDDTIFVMEAVTNAGPIIHHLNLTKVRNIPVNQASALLIQGNSRALFSAVELVV